MQVTKNNTVYHMTESREVLSAVHTDPTDGSVTVAVDRWEAQDWAETDSVPFKLVYMEED